MKSLSIKICICSFLFGVFFYSIVNVPLWILFNLIAWSIFLCFLSYKRKYIFLIFIALIFLCIGYVRHYISAPVVNENSVHFYQSEFERHNIKGVIAENPDRRRDKVNYIIEVKELFAEGEWKTVNGRILISKDLYPEYNYGDLIEINGYIIQPAEFDTFSYKNYLSLFSVYSVMYYPKVSLLSKENGSPFFSILFSLKSRFEHQLNKLFPEPMASFEAGLLTGSRKGIPDELMQNFNLTGLTHIIAISGYNISLIIILISSLFSKISRNVKVPIIIIFIFLFTLFVGASPAVVRASIMGIISVLALWFGRQSRVINALLCSAFFMVIWNPQTLLYDVGFQLSFLATLGLILTGDVILKIFSFLPETFGLREAFTMTFSAQIFALPVILLNFKRLSLISPVANVLVVPFIPFAMFFGFLSVILSFINFSLGFIVTFPGWLVLKWMVLVTGFLAHLPFASYETAWFSYLHFIGYFLLFVVFSYFIYPNLRTVFRFR